MLLLTEEALPSGTEFTKGTKEVEATLDQYLAAGLIQHSTPPHSRPLVVISKKSGGVRITVNHKKTQPDQQHQREGCLFLAWTKSSAPWGRGGCFSSSIWSPRSTRLLPRTRTPVPLTAFFFCTPTCLYESLFIPQGSSASPGWFVMVASEVIKGLTEVVVLRITLGWVIDRSFTPIVQ